ncbi:CHAP domain-containing protein [Candidatus Saccharibacteria bacterium]|nr:CHAP domain-containing protein [Candidatus Saccharibacteria bacterium]
MKSKTKFSTKITLITIAVVMAFAAPIQLVQTAAADSYDDQMSSLQQTINAYNARAAELSQQADTLQNAVNILQQQANALQAEINLSQAQYDKLSAQIVETEKQIQDNQDALGKIIADMYVDGSVTPVEMLASSKSIGDYLDKQEAQASVRSQLNSTIDTVKKLKADLEKQQSDVKIVLDKQNAQKANLAANQEQQQSLLDQTRGQEAAYQQLVSDTRTRLESIAAQQRAYYASLNGNVNSGVVGSFQYKNWSGNFDCGSDGYPYCGYQDSYSDPWGLYNRECVSYAAWALVHRFGKYVGHFRGSGNAYEWPSSAPRYSGAWRVYDPQPGDAVVLPQMGNFSPIGHLMIVESVSGGWVHISQYNFYGTGEYSTMDIRNSGVIFLRFPSA